LSFVAIREERDWPETIVKGFQIVAQVFANALARKRGDEALREKEERLSLATNAAGAGLWMMEPETGHVWVTPKTRELFHFAPDQVLDYKSLLEIIHPEDRERVRQAVQQTLQFGENLWSEYRIFLPDGSIRWIIARGQRFLRSAGGPVHILGVSLDTTERKLTEKVLAERLQFESLLSDLSAGFVNLPPDKVDGQIKKGLRSITEFFDVDRCSIGLFSADGGRLALAFEYHAEDTEPAPESISKQQMPWYLDQLLQGNAVVINQVGDLPPEAERERQLCLGKGMKSFLSVPLASGGKTLGSCALVSTRAERVWPKDLVQRFRLASEVFANALARKRADEEIRKHLKEIENLKQRLEKENIYLQEEVKLLAEHTEIVSQSLAMKNVLSQAEQVAPTESTVLIQGESGTGKELLARAIHGLSSRKDRPLVTVNCASLPPTLIESELFGREKGAYTGALTKMMGRFEVADGSTLFLDEIGELPLDVQSKLLRVLEDGSFERLGSTKTLHVNVRIIAATNRDLGKDVKAGRFRKDLYYRLNVFPITIPPLRERPEDIPLMVSAFVRKLQKRMGKEIETISKKSIEC
jgi:PAS domain S-box-containing protein